MKVVQAEAALWIGGGLLAAFLIYKLFTIGAAAIANPDKAFKAVGSTAGKAVVGVGQGALAAVGVDSNKVGAAAGSTLFDWLHPNPQDTSASALTLHWVGQGVDSVALGIDGVLN